MNFLLNGDIMKTLDTQKLLQKKVAALLFCGATIFIFSCATISPAADFRFPHRAAESKVESVVNGVADEMADDVSTFSVSTIIRGQTPTTMRGETPPQVTGLNLSGLGANANSITSGLGTRSVSAAESELAIRPPDPLGAMDAAAIPEAIKPTVATAPQEAILPSETISPETTATEIKSDRSGEGNTLLLIFALAASGLAAYAIFVALDYKQRWEQALIQQNNYFLGGFNLEKEPTAMPMPQW